MRPAPLIGVNFPRVAKTADIKDTGRRHKKLCKVLRDALAWCKQDATNEDCFPSQEMLDARVQVLAWAVKLAKGQ